MDRALVEKTQRSITSIAEMKSIKSYYLVGGTALSIQLEHRLSEDLDFMRWQNAKGDCMDIDVRLIKQELEERNHLINSIDILEANHVVFIIDDGVKLSFYAPEKKPPVIKTVPYIGNINLLDIDTIAVLKLETMLRRSNFRDYYDLYVILQKKSSKEIISIIDKALRYSDHTLKSKNLLGKLVNYEQFTPDSEFKSLEPTLDVTPKEIAQFMNDTVRAAYQNKNLQMGL